MDARFIDHEKKIALAVEMSCPWKENREKKQEEKTTKYSPLCWELKQQFPGYDIRQYNIIIDVLGGWSTEVDEAMRETVRGSRRRDSTPDAESHHLAHPEHYPHTGNVVLRTAEE